MLPSFETPNERFGDGVVNPQCATFQLVEARRDDDDRRYWREVIPSLCGDGRGVSSGSGYAILNRSAGALYSGGTVFAM